MKFQKIFAVALILAAMTGITACEEEEKVDYTAVAAPDIQLVTDVITSAEFGTTIQIEGSVKSEIGVRDIAYVIGIAR